MASFSVGQSKVKTWRNCRRAFDWKYVQNLQRRRVKRPFMFGKIVHRMVEAYGQEEDPMDVLGEIEFADQKLFTAEREMYGDIIADIGLIMEEYFRYHHDGLRMLPVPDESGALRFAEHEFAVPLEELVARADRARVRGIIFKGQVDGFGKTPNKLRWLVEHKTHDNMPGEEERWRSVQAIVYRKAALHLGWVPALDGVCWNYIRSKAPTIPHVIKDGSRLSNQQIVTLPSVVRKTLRDAKLKIEDHVDHIRAAEASRDQYFHRVYSPVSSVVADNIFGGFVESACEMRDSAGKRRDQNVGRHCSWCDYEPLCRAELTGGDVDFVKQGEYTVEDPEAYRRSSRAKAPAGGDPQGG